MKRLLRVVDACFRKRHYQFWVAELDGGGGGRAYINIRESVRLDGPIII